MGSLTGYLQAAFAQAAPPGWVCRAEAPLADRAATRRLGFEPRADLLMERADRSTRIWIEFEISRADPVANHAKFATARFLEGGSADEIFVSMVSRHVVTGRAALAAGTALAMRAMGVPAFQVDLLPHLDAAAIKQLNATPRLALDMNGDLHVHREVGRVLEVGQVEVTGLGHRIHKADNPWTVGVNIREWNRQRGEPEGAALWGCRPVQYLAFDPASGLFAPSKFCAFVPSPLGGGAGHLHDSLRPQPVAMSMALYASLGEADARFDGHVARRHLEARLGFRPMPVSELPQEVARAFRAWHSPLANVVPMRAAGVVLLPPRR
jgi:hypothetical protein